MFYTIHFIHNFIKERVIKIQKHFNKCNGFTIFYYTSYKIYKKTKGKKAIGRKRHLLFFVCREQHFVSMELARLFI